jgi:hypothetical protein
MENNRDKPRLKSTGLIRETRSSLFRRRTAIFNWNRLAFMMVLRSKSETESLTRAFMMRQYRAIDNVEENREDWISWKRDQHAFKFNIII